jgi:photosystem II stability/assembly factor-like uncharacterized protein
MGHKLLRLCALVLFILALLHRDALDGFAGDDTWSTTGPYGLRIMGLVVDPNDDRIIYATTPEGSPYVFKSTDGGDTWLPSGSGLGGAGWTDSLVIDPRDSSVLYVAGGEGPLYKSSDAGQTWVARNVLIEDTGTKFIRAMSVAVSPIDGTVYAGGYDWVPSPDDAGGGIFRSKDGGETWERLANGAPTGTVGSLILAPSAPHIIYAGSSDSGIGIYRSTDSGNSWQPIHNGFANAPRVMRIAVDPHDSQVVYMSVISQGVYKSKNGGASWTPIGSGLNMDVRTIIIDPDNQQTLYAGGGADIGSPGVYRSLDQGLSWVPMMSGMGGRTVWGLALDRSTPQSMFAGTGSGIWKYTFLTPSADYGVSINGGALFTNQTAVTLTLTAPPGTTQMQISNDGGFGGAAWEPMLSSKPSTITSYGAYVIPRVVYAKFKTNGQVSGLYQDDIVLDQTPPAGSVEITDPIPSALTTSLPPAAQWLTPISATTAYTVYLPLASRNYIPGYRPVGLVLAASDDLSGVGSMIISVDADFSDAQWQAFVPHLAWYVKEKGASTVFVKYRDGAGNVSQVYSASTDAP